MTEKTICYIDDCEANLRLIEKTLSGDYQVIKLDSPVDAHEQVASIKPDLILLDVHMPEVDGYEVCRRIRSDFTLDAVPVIFLTCRTSLEDRLTGYAAGGDAYITKPYDLAELRHIIDAHLHRYQRYQEAEEKATSASSMVWTMMQNNSETGLVIQYARALTQTRDETALLENTFSALNAFGLHSTILLRTTAGEIVARSDAKPFTPIEAELLQLARNGNRISHVGNKYLFCARNCIFLIRNMPIDDEALTGRLRDHLAIMLESCEACIELINYRQKEQQALAASANQTESAITSEFHHIISMFENLNGKAKQTFDRLAINIEESFMFLALTEEQEAQLTHFIETAKEDIERYLDQGASLREALARVARAIHALSDRSGTHIV